MGNKTKENLRTILYFIFFLHPTSSLFPVYETVIFHLKLPVKFCGPVSTYLERDIACSCQLSIYLTKQVRMILLSSCLDHPASLASFHSLRCNTLSAEYLISSWLTAVCLCFQHFSNSACKASFQVQLLKNSNLFIFFCLATYDAVASFPLQFFLSGLSIACLSCIPHLCNSFFFFPISPYPRIFQVVWLAELNE